MPFAQVMANWIALPPAPQKASTMTLHLQLNTLAETSIDESVWRGAPTSLCYLLSYLLRRHAVPRLPIELYPRVEKREKAMSLMPVCD